MGTEEYSDFDSDSGEELLYDMRDEKEEKEAAIQSNDEGEKLKDNGKETSNFNLNYQLLYTMVVPREVTLPNLPVILIYRYGKQR